jgi:hypothetical protein
MPYNVKDANLIVTKPLPNGAATTTSGAIDLGDRSTGDFVADCEAVIDAPALTTAELPDTQTVTYNLIHSANADLSGPVVLGSAVIVQTGAGGAGAAAASARRRLPSDVKRYVGLQQVKTGAANAGTKSGTLSLVF